MFELSRNDSSCDSVPEVIKLFSMLSSVEHEILNAHKYKYIK